ncbi:MAG: oligosaccharide flippase family protein [Pseudomonadota bacterium]
MKLLQAGNLRIELLIGLTLRGLGAVSSFALAWLIARHFGAETYGLFQLAMATALIAYVIASMGLDRVIIRTVSVALDEGRRGDAATAYRVARNRQVIVGLVMAILMVATAEPLAKSVLNDPAAANHLIIFAPTALITALTFLCAGVLRSAGRIILSQSLDGVSYTTLAALIVLVAWLGYGGSLGENPLAPAIAFVGSTALVLLVGLYHCERLVNSWGSGEADVPVLSGLFIASVNLMGRIANWVGLVLLIAAAGAAEGGIFRVAFQVCLLFVIVNSSFAVMVGPRIAAASARADRVAVTKAIRTASLMGIAVCLPLYLALMIFPESILALFGPEFTRGADAMRILATGQLINVAFGPIGGSLAMMHKERANLIITMIAAAISIAVIVLTVETYGMAGVAAGVAVNALLFNGLAWIVMKRHLDQLGGTRITDAPQA